MQIDNILLIIPGSDTKGYLLRLLITVVCVGWNFLMLDWQFTGDCRLYGVAVVGFPVGSFLIIIRWDINSEFSLCYC